MTGAQLLGVAILVALVLGVGLRARRGKVRGAKRPSGLPREVLAELDKAAGVTLVMFTTKYCANCKYTRPVLHDLVEHTDGLGYAEIDLTDQPELARQVSVLSTPTTLAVAASGAELLRVGGVPKRDDLAAALGPHLR